jgi:immunity protein, SdpI family
MIRTGLIWSIIFIAIMAAIAYWTSQNLPDQALFPVHWGIDGTPDRFVDKQGAIRNLWMLPGISAFVSLVLAIAPLIDPRKNNIFKARQFYLLVWIATMVLMTIITLGISFAMRGVGGEQFVNDQFVRLVIGGISLLYLLIGNYLPKTKPSFSFGIRTPWTLSSNTTWEKTHRLGGRLFILAGLIGAVSAFFLNGIWLALALPAMVLVIVAICFVYSWLAWRKADDKIGQTDYVE